MARTLTKDEISGLPVEERLKLISELWDSIPADEIPLPDSHRRALEDALREHARDPQAGQSWETVRDELFRKK